MCGYKSPAPSIWLCCCALSAAAASSLWDSSSSCFLSLPCTSCNICLTYPSSFPLNAKVKKCCVIALRRHHWFSLWQPIVFSFCPLRVQWFVFLLSLPWHRPENADTVWHLIPPGRVRLSAVCVCACLAGDSVFTCTVGLNMKSAHLV